MWDGVGPAWAFALLAALQVGNVVAAVEFQLIAHRGGVVDKDRIENNRPAIEEAIRRGYWMLEVDIRASKDGELIVHHDEDFQRYYGDGRRVSDLTLAEIRQLRSSPGNLRPLEFTEFAAACQGKIRLMLDVKGEHDAAFYLTLRKVLDKNGLLESCYVLGPEQAKRYFRDAAKVSIGGNQLRAAIANKENVAESYFLFGIAAKMDEAIVRLAQQHHVAVVPAINTFRYDAAQHREEAAQDIKRLRDLGVTQFQIDSIYDDEFLRRRD